MSDVDFNFLFVLVALLLVIYALGCLRNFWHLRARFQKYSEQCTLVQVDVWGVSYYTTTIINARLFYMEILASDYEQTGKFTKVYYVNLKRVFEVQR